MLGKTGDDPLSIEDGVRWWLHIDSNAGLSLSVQLDGENTIRYINTDHGGGYSCLDESLQSQIDKDFDLSIGSGDRTKQQHNFMNMWYEANQTSKIISEIERMARAYNLIPSKSESKYSSRDVRERMWRSVVNWVIWGEFVPEFRWGKTIFSESNRGEGIERTIRLFKQPEGSWHNADELSNQDEEKLDLGRKDAIKGMTNDGRFMRSARLDPKIRNQRRMVWKEHKRRGHKRMTKETRIRTWAIYFLTKRGGGRMSEEVAVDTWNDFTWSRDPEAPTIFRNNYQVERNRLFSRESTKKP